MSTDIHTSYTQKGFNAFVSELKKNLGDSNVIENPEPTEIINNISHYKINLKSIKKYFDSDIKSISKYNWSSTKYVSTREFIDYMISTNTADGLGMYFLYMDLIHELFQIKFTFG